MTIFPDKDPVEMPDCVNDYLKDGDSNVIF